MGTKTYSCKKEELMEQLDNMRTAQVSTKRVINSKDIIPSFFVTEQCRPSCSGSIGFIAFQIEGVRQW
jgi:hypothetical protein